MKPSFTYTREREMNLCINKAIDLHLPCLENRTSELSFSCKFREHIFGFTYVMVNGKLFHVFAESAVGVEMKIRFGRKLIFE